METAGQSLLAVEKSAGLGFLGIAFVITSRFLFIEWNTRRLPFPRHEIEDCPNCLVLKLRGRLRLTVL